VYKSSLINWENPAVDNPQEVQALAETKREDAEKRSDSPNYGYNQMKP